MELQEALAHGSINELFPGIHFVSGVMDTILMQSPWRFSRNMTVVANEGQLTLVNSIRLSEVGLRALESLGQVAHVVRLGAMHGRDDLFYVHRYGARFWADADIAAEEGLPLHQALTEEGEVPFTGCTVFRFRTARRPEYVLRVDREGGIMIACDSLQNWLAPDEYFSEESRKLMTEMGFFQKANFGPLWMHLNEPQAEDFARLLEFPFRHTLCAHGEPLIDEAKPAYMARFAQIFADSPVKP